MLEKNPANPIRASIRKKILPPMVQFGKFPDLVTDVLRTSKIQAPANRKKNKSNRIRPNQTKSG
jgi:hypothetical protein